MPFLILSSNQTVFSNNPENNHLMNRNWLDAALLLLLFWAINKEWLERKHDNSDLNFMKENIIGFDSK